MQRSLTRLSDRPACELIRLPTTATTNRFVGRSSVLRATTIAPTRNEYSVIGIIGRKSVCRSEFFSHHHRNYIRGAVVAVDNGSAKEERQPATRNNSSSNKNDAIALNRKITGLGKEGRWKEILRLVETEHHKFDNVNWSTAFSQLGRIKIWNRADPRFESFLNGYAARLENRGLRWAGIRQVANAVHALGKIKAAARNHPDEKTTTTTKILSFVSKAENARQMVQKGTPQEVANTAWAFAKLDFALCPKNHFFFAEIEANARWLATNGKPQHVANTAWACAKLGVASPRLFVEIEKRAEWLVENAATPQEVANTAWACATLNAKNCPELFAAIERNAAWLVSDGSPQEVANVAWAFATLGVKECPNLVAAIERHADRLVDNGTPQNVANTAWALATIGIKKPPPDSFLAKIEKRAEWLVRYGTPQAIANTAWAFATLGVGSLPLFAQIEARAEWLVNNGKPQELSNAAWAFATLGTNCPKLFAAIETRAEWLATTGTPQNVANTAWASATTDAKSPQLFAAIEKHAERLVAKGSSQAVANISWAVGHFQYHSPDWMKETNSHGAWLVETGTTQEISNAAISFARFGYRDGAATFFRAVANNGLPKLLRDGNPQEIINVCYAMAILDLGKKHGDALLRLWDTAIRLDAATLRDEELSQLGQVFAFCTASGMKLPRPPPRLARSIKAVVHDSTQSHYQREVATIIKERQLGGLDCCEEQVSPLLLMHNEKGGSPMTTTMIDNGMLSIDIACRSRRLAIEYDGASHFLREVGTGRVARGLENGTTKAKRRFLQRMGWNVVNIDYRDWMDAKNQNRREEFLREKINPETNNATVTKNEPPP